jgi:hypothetical protein
VEVRPFFVTILAIILAGTVLFGVRDTALSIADTSVPDLALLLIETASSKANNSSASAGIVITMTGVLNE